MSNESNNDKEINQRVRRIENHLDRLTRGLVARPAYRDDEIDLKEIWNMLWGGKWLIIGITSIFLTASVLFALSVPNQYKAEVVLARAQDPSGSMSGLASQYGGLAAMAGIGLGSGQNSDIDQAMALVKSWPFLDAFVKKYDLKPLVVAVKGWDSVNDEVIFDKEMYDPETKLWASESRTTRKVEPTSYEIYQAISKMVTISHDAKTGLIRLSIEHYVPRIAFEWTELLIKELNYHFQIRDIKETKQNINYLRDKIDETSVAEMQSVFYRMIESQMKTLMLAEVSDEYLVKSVVQPKVPESRSKPMRALICVVGMILGSMIGIFVVVVLRLAKGRPRD